MNRNITALILVLYIFGIGFFTFRTLFIVDITGHAASLGVATVNLTVPCADRDGDGYYDDMQCPTGTDCLDTNSAVHPGASEICGNGLDDDCDGTQAACPQQPADDTAGGGGGGGGGNIDNRQVEVVDQNVEEELFFGDDNFFIELPNTSKPEYDPLIFDKYKFEYDVMQGEYLLDGVNILSASKDDLLVKVSLSGYAKNFLSLDEESFIIGGLSRKLYRFSVAIPSGIAPGTYEGNINFEAAGKTMKLDVAIEVTELDSPFRITLQAESITVGDEGVIEYEVGPIPTENDVMTRIRLFDPFTNITLFEMSEINRFVGIFKGKKVIKTEESMLPKRYLLRGEAYYTTESGSIIKTETTEYLTIKKRGALYYARFPLLLVLLLATVITLFTYARSKVKRKFQILPTYIEGSIHPGESFQTAIEFRNYTGEQQFLKVELSGDISKIIKLANSNLIVDDNQDIRTIWVFSVDANAMPGQYKGKISTKSNTLKEEIKVKLKVLPKGLSDN